MSGLGYTGRLCCWVGLLMPRLAFCCFRPNVLVSLQRQWRRLLSPRLLLLNKPRSMYY
jgi:hypothetical protein